MYWRCQNRTCDATCTTDAYSESSNSFSNFKGNKINHTCKITEKDYIAWQGRSDIIDLTVFGNEKLSVARAEVSNQIFLNNGFNIPGNLSSAISRQATKFLEPLADNIKDQIIPENYKYLIFIIYYMYNSIKIYIL